MKPCKLIALVCCMFFISSCGDSPAEIAAKNVAIAAKKAEAEAKSDEGQVKQAVRNSLKDPDSAKFGSFVLIGEDGACITVNARNSFGGYVGDRHAYLVKTPFNDWHLYGITDRGLETCKHLASANKF